MMYFLKDIVLCSHDTQENDSLILSDNHPYSLTFSQLSPKYLLKLIFLNQDQIILYGLHLAILFLQTYFIQKDSSTLFSHVTDLFEETRPFILQNGPHLGLILFLGLFLHSLYFSVSWKSGQVLIRLRSEFFGDNTQQVVLYTSYYITSGDIIIKLSYCWWYQV